MITDEHSLLEECRIRAGIAELTSHSIAHMIDLAVGLHVRIVPSWPVVAREIRLWIYSVGAHWLMVLQQKSFILNNATRN